MNSLARKLFEFFSSPGKIEFREPWFLLAGLSALVILFFLKRNRGVIRFSALSLLPQGTSWRARTAWVPPALLALSAIMLSVALAGPRLPDAKQKIRKEGIAIMMVMDISSSMMALDLSKGDDKKTRLDAVKETFDGFVTGKGELKGRPDDAIGLVTFAGFADSRCPLTLDHSVLRNITSEVEIVGERREDGTAIGDGLGLAVLRLKESEAKSKVAILLTDGVSNRGEETPMGAAELAKEYGIKVYTIGAGTTGRATVMVQTPFGPREQSVPVEIDEDTLRAIAEETGGQYFRATRTTTGSPKCTTP